tara:strand:+ start:571 stop:762 length:192 start_codon:yes stop_codon:yes gene_type:complete
MEASLMSIWKYIVTNASQKVNNAKKTRTKKALRRNSLWLVIDQSGTAIRKATKVASSELLQMS